MPGEHASERADHFWKRALPGLMRHHPVTSGKPLGGGLAVACPVHRSPESQAGANRHPPQMPVD
ncbi:hypothetical protein Pan241w_03840 [Gimesia alba]|uniref:Uncharacterized protein n=1 Tax=Gimesia alba TaxID=2527973 RepID=A0A517R8Z8_9PLAN|nr:hypothetical protein [Gimesia alba]QDT40328.1 hypothetical protein Pan241w_03840 [Gimesia alba]